ncbi:MAG: hypothetical protein ABIT37_25345 [Luteolibacter sp.]
MKNPWIVPVAALVVGAAGGYISGKNTEPSGKTAAVEESAQRTRSSSRPEGAGETTSKKARGMGPDQIAKMPGNSNRIQALLEFYAGLTPEQLAEEAGKLENLPMNERLMASFLLFGRWAEVDPTAAMAFSNTMGMAGGFVRPTILQSWASVDPANAAKYYSQNPREFAMMDAMGGRGGPMGGQGASSIIASEWARQDPAAAMAWANSLTNGKGQAMTAVVSEVAKTDPKKAAEMLASMDPADRPGAYKSVAAQYGAVDFASAQSWIRTLPAEDQAAALASAIGGLSGTDPAKAALEVKSMEAGDAKDRAVGVVVGDLAKKDPEAAAAFLKSQDSEKAMQDGMRPLMQQWAAQNPAAALAFVNSNQPGPVRDSAAGAYVWNNNTSKPSDLIKVAESITDEGDRNRSVGVTAMKWMAEDPAAAKAYIQASTSIPDDAKERLMNGGGGFGGGMMRGVGGNNGGGNRGGGNRGGGNRGGN